LKTPITYYGGKQNLATRIVSLLPEHSLYAEPFCGGAAVFFKKYPSEVEVINDTNRLIINFYRQVKNNFVALEKEIKISLHSRDLYRRADVIYKNPDMFSELKQAWALWVLAQQSFSAKLNGSWGYDIAKNTTSKKINNKRESFTEDYAIRLQSVQIECTDAIRIITSRDRPNSFFYCDPPYYNSDCGHYDGYSLDDYTNLLETLSKIEGKFLLSSYPSPVLKEFKEKHGWSQIRIEGKVSVSRKKYERKPKVEVLTANYKI